MSVERNDHAEAGRDPLLSALGWMSLGIGVVASVAPAPIARLLSVDDIKRAPDLIRVAGVRDLLLAAGLVAGPRATIWGRAASEAVDTSVLLAARSRASGRSRAWLTALAVGSVAAAGVDVYAAVRGRGRRRQHGCGSPGPLHLAASTEIDAPVEAVYAYWRDLSNLPSFMTHLRSVTVDGDGRLSHWEAESPLMKPMRWDAEMTGDDPNRRLSWKSIPGSDIANSGTVHFAPAPGGRGTEVRVSLHYDVPGGELGRAVAGLLGEAPEQQVGEDLQQLKRMLETGSVVLADAGRPTSAHLVTPPRNNGE